MAQSVKSSCYGCENPGTAGGCGVFSRGLRQRRGSPGIAAEHFETIFQPFMQLGGYQASRDGVGLGLATSRALARRMGGDLSVASTIGEGSIFTLRLPA